MADSVHTLNLSRRHLLGAVPSIPLAIGTGVALAAQPVTPQARIEAAMQVVQHALAELYPHSKGLDYAIAFTPHMHFVATCFAEGAVK